MNDFKNTATIYSPLLTAHLTIILCHLTFNKLCGQWHWDVGPQETEYHLNLPGAGPT
jgi:hypothetical protein